MSMDNVAGSISDRGNTNRSDFPLTLQQAGSSAKMVLVADFYDYANTTAYKQARWSLFYLNSDGNLVQTFGNGVYKVNDAITSIYIDVPTGPSFSAGTYELFGVK
jgi:hypothetical protein